jgi:cofilin
VFEEMKLAKKYKFIAYALSPDYTHMVVDRRSTEPDYETFLEELSVNDFRCLYAVCDVEYKAEGGKRNELCFFNCYGMSTSPCLFLLMFHATGWGAVRRSGTR